MSSPTASVDTDDKEGVEINLDETRDELFRALESEASVQMDALSHEQIRTISEEKLRSTLEGILKRQLDDAKRRSGLRSSTEVVTTTTFKRTTTAASAVTLSSQLICQFFVFGTLFGVVCSISTCTCCLHPRNDRRSNFDLNGVNPTNVPAPIDYSKPYMLKCDSRGSCYASPLSDGEVPPLPSYTEALSCSTQPARKPQCTPKDALVV
ncbi:hypothetical protein Tcan_15644 [Toxocara canis]|uniref:Uncharacterized protein n=1 Tax=Toxocara canis TaxID=6265 RepID=A0A0B2VHE8_TOXCA|nr:hypothetical protein Tcan_15644 [Toxocara canis]